MARLLRFAAAVALGGLATAGLTACTGGGSDASPSPTPVVTVSTDMASPSPTPTLTPEEELLAQIPEDARGESFPEAINFSRFFLELYGPMFRDTYETQLFSYLCDKDTPYCQSSLERAHATETAAARTEGGVLTWDDGDIAGGLQADGFMYVTQGFALTDETTYLADGSLYDVARGGTGLVGTKLRFEDGAWHVYGVDFEFDDD